MNKFIITRWEGRVLTALINEEGVFQLGLEDDGEKSLLNNIYIGKVKNVVKNIGAAFVELGNGQMAYYSLTENTRHHYTKPHGNGPLHAGDEIIVQVSKDAVKTKDPVISSPESRCRPCPSQTPGRPASAADHPGQTASPESSWCTASTAAPGQCPHSRIPG